MKIELTDQQINNLKAFLERVSLSGREVPMYLEAINALNNPIKEEPKE